jgi:pimeloyl-ACP methyl ester carboxylesterase
VQTALHSGFVETDGGLRLYFKATGTGPRTLVCCNGVGVSTFFWKYVVEHFRDGYRVVVWDYRGHGRSERPHHPDAADLSIPACARDLGRVLDALGVEQAVLLGHSMGCQVILEFARQQPHRVTGLVPMLGSAGRVLDTFYDSDKAARAYPFVFGLTEALGEGTSRMMEAALRSPLAWYVTRKTRMVDPVYTSEADFRPYLDHMAEIDPRLFLRMVGQAHEHDAFDVLPGLRVPSLVIAAENDTFTPLWLSERMAREIPGAELMVLADASHAAIIEQPATINHRLERFLNQRVRWPQPATGRPPGSQAG